MKEIFHGPELTSPAGASTLKTGEVFVMPDGPSHEAMKGPEIPLKTPEVSSPGAESAKGESKVRSVLGKMINKTIFRAKDDLKKEDVRDSLADEIVKESVVPGPGVGMPEEIIEAEDVRPTGTSTGAREDATGTASDSEDSTGAGDSGEPEAAAGGSGAGDGGEPPRGEERRAGFEDEGEDDDSSKEEIISSKVVEAEDKDALVEEYRKVESPSSESFTFENFKKASEKINKLNDKVSNIAEGGEKLTQEEYDEVYKYLRSQEPPKWPEQGEEESDEDFKKRNDKVREERARFNREMDSLNDTLRRITGEINRVGRNNIIEQNQYSRDKYENITPEILQLISESKDFDRLNEMLDMIDLSGNEVQSSEIIGKIAQESLKVQRESGEFKGTYGYAVEYLVERLLSISDTNPEGRYHQFNFTQQQNLDSVIESARDHDPWFYNYLKKLQTTRYVGHEMFRTRKDWKNQSEIIAGYLNKRGLSFIEHDIVGTDRVQQIYEQVLGDKVQSTKTWLLEEDLAEADKSARIIFGQDQRKIKKTIRYGVYNPATGEWDPEVAKAKVRSEAGELVEQPVQRGMQDFEINRGYLMGRSVMTGVQRRLVYQMIGDRIAGQGGITSLESDSIAARLAPLKFTAFRYFVGPGPVRYLRNWRDRKVKEASWNGKTYGVKVDLPDELKDLGLREDVEWGQYGASIDSVVLRDTGNQDPQSNGWRGFFMFLDHKDYKTAAIGEEQLTIGEYLRREKVEVMNDSLDEPHYHKPDYASLGKIGDHDPSMDLEHRGPHAVLAFNTRVAETIGKQRLFLGALMRDGDLSRDNKAVIWGNVSELLPSRIAAILPEHRKAIIKSVYGRGLSDEQVETQWDQVKKQIWRMERARVYEDAELIKNGKTPTKNLRDYYSLMNDPLEKDGAAISATEQERVKSVVDKLQKLGKHNKHNLANMISPSNAFLDDVPDRGWQELGATDLDRLFLGDQDNFEQGYNHLMPMLANPTIAPDKADGGFHEFFEKVQVTLGPSSTQELVEPFIMAYYEMAKIYQKAKFVPGMRYFRKPRSQMEEVNMSSGIAMYPEDIAAHLNHLAQMEVISDDPAHAVPIEELRGKSIPGRRSLQQIITGTKKLTQLQRLKYETHSSGEDISNEKIRIMSLTFGALLLLEMLIASLPEDAGAKLR